MREYSIAAIPADGIGPEVIAAGLQALETLEQRAGDFKLHVKHFDWGSDYYKKTRPHDAGGRPRAAQGLRRHLLRRRRRARRSRPHHAVGPAAADLPGLRPVRQRAADPDPAGHLLAARRRRPRRSRLGDRARELGRRVCRPGRAHAPRAAGGSRQRRCRSSPASASPASCATPSGWRSPARASC